MSQGKEWSPTNLLAAEPMKAHFWTSQTASERDVGIRAKDIPKIMREYARLVLAANLAEGEDGDAAAEMLGQIDEKLDRWEGVQRQLGQWKVDMSFGIKLPRTPEVVVKYTFKDAAEAEKFEQIIKERLEKDQGDNVLADG